MLEFVPDTVYRISKHYSKSAQRMPSIYVKLYTYQMARPGPAARVPLYALQHPDLPAFCPPDRTGNNEGPCGIDDTQICLFGRPVEPNHGFDCVRPSCSQVRVLTSVAERPRCARQ